MAKKNTEAQGDGKTRWVNILQFSKIAGISTKMVRLAIEAGRITSYKGEVGSRLLDAEKALKEFRDTQNPAKVISAKQNGAQSAKHKKPDAEFPLENEAAPEVKVNGNVGETFGKARAAKMVYEAKIEELKYKQLTGELVPKAEVYKDLYAVGQTVRDNILAVPTRVVNDVMAAPNSVEAINIMRNELMKALEALANIENFNSLKK